MALVAERKKSSVRVFDLIQLGSIWKLRRGREDVVVGSGLEVVSFLKEVPRKETLIRMWDDEPVTVLLAIRRVNHADRADWENGS